jgi:hypothetical protein
VASKGACHTCREPEQNLAAHYDTAILPTRPRKPRDKAKVEVAVLIIERYVLARLRNRRFFSLFELNTAIRQIVANLNARIRFRRAENRIGVVAVFERAKLRMIAAGACLPSEKCGGQPKSVRLRR